MMERLFNRLNQLSLFEIAVIILVIGIVVGIVYPLFPRRHEHVYPDHCLQHQRQIGIAISMYTQDNGDTYPPAPTAAWPALIAKYDGSDRLYNCPTSRFTGTCVTPEYGFNAELFGKSLTQIHNPVSILVTADIDPHKLASPYTFSADAHAASYFGTVITPRHNHVFICRMADGAVRGMHVLDGATVASVLQQEQFRVAIPTVTPSSPGRNRPPAHGT